MWLGILGGESRARNVANWHVQLDARSIIEGWDVPVEERAKTIERLVKLRDEADGSRDSLRACEALLKIPGMQIASAQLKLAQEEASGGDATGLIEEMEKRAAEIEGQAQSEAVTGGGVAEVPGRPGPVQQDDLGSTANDGLPGPMVA